MFGQSLLSGAFGSAACTTDTDQLFTSDATTTSTATYQLNNATTSIPSNTYPGTASNITYTTGKFGDAAVFNGSNSRINIGASNNFASNKLTISFWANPGTGNNNNYQMLFSNYIGGSLADYDFIIDRQSPNNASNAEKLEVGISGTGSAYAYILTDSAVFTPGTWKNYVIVFDTTESANVDKVKIYVNGTLAARSDVSSSGTVTGSLLNTSDDLLIGDWPHDTTHKYSGIMDQVRIFNSALPQSAVTALYNETVATSSSASINYVNANPNSIAYYKMSNASDQLGNYNGTATNVNFNTEGKFGFAGAFNGSSSRIGLGTNTFNSLTNLTFSCWVNLNNAPSSYEYLFDGWDYQSGSSRGFGVRINSSGNVQAISGFSNSTSTNTSSATVSYGNWTHIAVSITQSNTTFSINGNTESPQSNNGFDFHTGTTYNLGAFIYTGSVYEYFLDGKLDQIRIYDSAISAADVTTLYKEIECPAATVINSFNPVIYTGTGGTQSISTVGFAPDFVWIKQRTAPNRDHVLHDIIRGSNKVLYANLSNSQDTLNASYFTSFDSNGFTLGGDSYYNGSSLDYVAWSWKGGGTAVSNTDGTIASSVSANQAAGFSIASYTSTGTNGSTFGHGLNAIPELVLLKCTSTNSTNWIVGGSILGNDYYLSLNSAAARQSSSNWLVPSAKTLQLNQTFGNANSSGREYITYNFTSIPGYSRVGYYIGNGSPTGPIIYTGFKPRFIMTKPSSIGDNWSIWGVNQSGNDIDQILVANNNASQSAVGFGRYNITLSSTGFQLKRSDSQINQNGATYIFLAIA